MNPVTSAAIDARTARLIAEIADLRAFISYIADFLDVWSYTDEELAHATPGTAEHLAFRIKAAVRNGEQQQQGEISPFPVDPERWRDVLDTALEHGAHAWGALMHAGLAHVADAERQMWPPQCTDEAGSAAYHVAALIDYVFTVYNGICLVHPESE